MQIIPFSSKFLRLSSPVFGNSRVISSAPNFVSRASHSYFDMDGCVDIFLQSSSLNKIDPRSYIPSQGMNATNTLKPNANSLPICSWTICQYLDLSPRIDHVHDWFLVKACRLVRTHEFVHLYTRLHDHYQ